MIQSINSLYRLHIEGSHYQTNNEYYIYVYLKDHINNRYDKLIGFLKKIVMNFKIFN